MKTLIIITSLILFSTRLYAQINHDTTGAASCSGKTSAPYSKGYLAERFLFKKSQKIFTDFLNSKSGLRVASTLRDSMEPKEGGSYDSNFQTDPAKAKLYIKIEIGEWKNAMVSGVTPAPVYFKRSILCFIGREKERENEKRDLEVTCGDFRFLSKTMSRTQSRE